MMGLMVLGAVGVLVWPQWHLLNVTGAAKGTDKESHPLLTEFTLQEVRDAEIPRMLAYVIPLTPDKRSGAPENLP